jgi:hypothetical protein
MMMMTDEEMRIKKNDDVKRRNFEAKDDRYDSINHTSMSPIGELALPSSIHRSKFGPLRFRSRTVRRTCRRRIFDTKHSKRISHGRLTISELFQEQTDTHKIE